MNRKLAVLLGVLAAFGITLGVQGMASADVSNQRVSETVLEDSFSFNFVLLDDDKSGVINVYNDAWMDKAGHAEWRADPLDDGSTGDTLIAFDGLPDSYGIVAHLSTGRVASTAGHDANYTDEVSGNLPEGNPYTMWVCVVKGSFSTCSSHFGVKA